MKIDEAQDSKNNAPYKDKEDAYFDQKDKKSSENEEDKDETDSDDSSFELKESFSKSFMDKAPPSLVSTINKISALKTRLSTQLEKCENEIRRDLAKFNGSIKKQMHDGSLKEHIGDKSMKRTRNVIREELTKVHDALVTF